MLYRKKDTITTPAPSFTPNEISYEILLSKNLIHQKPEIMHFVIINRNKYHPVFPQ